MINLYIANLGKYNEGELVGAWVELPKTEEEIKEFLADQVGINEEYEEWAIHDFETDLEGLEVSEYSNIFELNELAERVEDFGEMEKEALQAFLEDGCKFNEAIEHVIDGDYCVYQNCDDMSDVAYYIIEENGLLNGVSETLQRYFDYEAYGRDLDIEGSYHSINRNYYELNY